MGCYDRERSMQTIQLEGHTEGVPVLLVLLSHPVIRSIVRDVTVPSNVVYVVTHARPLAVLVRTRCRPSALLHDASCRHTSNHPIINLISTFQCIRPFSTRIPKSSKLKEISSWSGDIRDHQKLNAWKWVDSVSAPHHSRKTTSTQVHFRHA